MKEIVSLSYILRKMNINLRYLFVAVLIFSTYHLFRDVLQILEVNNLFSDFLHRPHMWCKPYCNYVTFPLDFFGIIGSTIVLKRKKAGVLGVFIIITLPLWLTAMFLP